jgi:hypothetical protein
MIMEAKNSARAERRRKVQDRITAQWAADSRHRRRVRLMMALTVTVLLSGAGTGIWYAEADGSHSVGRAAGVSDPSMDRSSALLASTAHQATGQTVDGIVESNSIERIAYHIHSHLTVFVGSERKLVPYGVGIVPPYGLQTSSDGGKFVNGGSKFYFLHTHDETGIIHVESPDQRQFTLGNFFHVWRQPLGPKQVGPYRGKVVVYVDRSSWT